MVADHSGRGLWRTQQARHHWIESALLRLRMREQLTFEEYTGRIEIIAKDLKWHLACRVRDRAQHFDVRQELSVFLAQWMSESAHRVPPSALRCCPCLASRGE